MRSRRCWSMVAVLMVVGSLLAPPTRARNEERTIRAANEVLAEFCDLHVKQIPEALLAEAAGVVIIPNLIKLGFVVGGQRGEGVVVVKDTTGNWCAPVFVTLTGGSIGWQIGAQSTDIVLVFKSQKSIDGLLEGKFTLGADAAVAAGPIGRQAKAATDGQLKAEIYSYSRSRGLFAGLSIDGSVLQIDREANASYYRAVGLGGAPVVPEPALRFVERIAKVTSEANAGLQPTLPATNLVPTPTNPAQAPPGALPRNALPQNQPQIDTEAIRGQLSQSAASLNPLLDASWQRYLALPAEVYQAGGQPSVEALRGTLSRYDNVASDPRYRQLGARPEFLSARDSLRAYVDALSSSSTARLALPPPPGAGTR